MGDYYRDLAADYHWIFPDEIVDFPGVIGGTSHDNRELIEATVSALPSGARVLDCACGIGTDAMALAHAGFQVTATDAGPGMVDEARRRLPAEVEVRVARWEELPAAVTGPYELVVCLGNSLVHAGSHQEMVSALSSMRQVLSPTGMLIVDSRNWELLYRERPRIVPADRVRERDGVRCWCVYVWSIPERFGEPCLAELLFLLERQDGSVTHRRHLIDFQPFTPADLEARLAEAGFAVAGSTYRPDRQRYAFACRVAG
ncbi:class I SAM-dependent methyltransferase [Nonomuraea turkmeniaca]|uniref:class I SAM-dependent methyltransferase n=1 Tax=Nonomuraea turkmeniaca TaxID=103838 RepID=UPI001476D149|nr:class I SAM-dependent methyltransferase [Nonomuraea turkmeniaca]